MVDHTIEKITGAIFFIGVFCFWLAVVYMFYLAYCRKNCGKNSSERHLDKTEAMFYVTKKASETSESHQEDETSFIVSLLHQYGF